jgi:hypothetical protein
LLSIKYLFRLIKVSHLLLASTTASTAPCAVDRTDWTVESIGQGRKKSLMKFVEWKILPNESFFSFVLEKNDERK